MATLNQERVGSVERVHCNNCHGRTLHKILATAHDRDSEDVDGQYAIWWDTVHDIFECCGCKAVVMRRTEMMSEWEEPDIRFFPPPASRHKPAWLYDIPHEIRLLLEEVYNSLDANNRALPLMGARAVVDKLMVDKVGDVGGFPEKLKALDRK